MELHSEARDLLLELEVFVVLCREFRHELLLLLRNVAELVLPPQQTVETLLHDLVLVLNDTELALGVTELLI